MQNILGTCLECHVIRAGGCLLVTELYLEIFEVYILANLSKKIVCMCVCRMRQKEMLRDTGVRGLRDFLPGFIFILHTFFF